MRCRSTSSTATTIAAQMADSRTDKLIAARRQAARVKHDHTLQTLERLADPKQPSPSPGSPARPACRHGCSTTARNSSKRSPKLCGINHHQSTDRRIPPGECGTAKPAHRPRTRTSRNRRTTTIGTKAPRTTTTNPRRRDRADRPIRARHPNRRTRNPPRKTPRREHTLTETNTNLTDLIAQQSDDLDTANTLLRRYMREASRVQTASTANPGPFLARRNSRASLTW